MSRGTSCGQEETKYAIFVGVCFAAQLGEDKCVHNVGSNFSFCKSDLQQGLIFTLLTERTSYIQCMGQALLRDIYKKNIRMHCNMFCAI